MINFTKEHFEKMRDLAIDMLFNNESIVTKMGSVLNIAELLHTTTIGTLNGIRNSLTEKIKEAENKDEWVSDLSDQKIINKLRIQKELVNLIIGWKRYNIEKESIKAERKALKDELNKLRVIGSSPIVQLLVSFYTGE